MNSPQKAASGISQSCYRNREDSSSQSLITNGTQNDAGHLERLVNSNENSVPLNLFQDSCNLKLDTLPTHHRSMLENLIGKINYQINYFCLEKKTKSNKIKLTCILCCVSLRIGKVEKHVLEQEHLRNLTKRCQNANKTSAPAAVSEKNWEFLDFDESFQCYQCTLCNVNLSESRNSWNKHFQSGPHRSKLKVLESEIPSNSINVLSSISNSETSNIGPQPNCVPFSKQMELNENLFDVITEILSTRNKNVLKAVRSELKDNINYFEPSYESRSDKLYLICKICKVTLRPQTAKQHISTYEHDKNLRKNMSFGTTAAVQKHVGNTVPLPSLHMELNKKSSIATDIITDSRKKLAVDLTHKLKDYVNRFEPSYENGSKKLPFFCKICNVSLPSKNTRLHIFHGTHLDHLRKNVSVVSGSFEWSTKPILKDLISTINNKLYFFQLIYDMESNEVYFICKVCTVVLITEDVKNHIHSSEHLENLQADPVVLHYDSLSFINKEIVKDLAAAIKNQIQHFTFVYRIGTDELRFYCRYCQLTLVPQKVENHVKASHHLKAVSAHSVENLDISDKVNLPRQNSYSDIESNVKIPPKISLEALSQNSPTFNSLTNKVKKIIQNFKGDANLKYFDLLHSVDSNKFHFKCKLCDLTLKPSHVANHVQVGYHVKNMTLSSYFRNFQSLQESSKQIVRKIFYEIGDALNDFVLLPDSGYEKPLFHCKLCDGTLSSDFVVGHLQTIVHQKFEKTKKSMNCSAANLKTSLQPHESNSLQTNEHQKSTRKNESANCTISNSKTSLQLDKLKDNLDYKPYSHKLVENINPASVSVGTSSPSTLLNLHKSTLSFNFESVRDAILEGLRKHSNETLSSDFNHQTSSNTNCFVCQDCSTVIHFGIKKKGKPKSLPKEIIERLFIRCCGKSAETALLNAKMRKISASRSSVVSIESEIAHFPLNSTGLSENFVESEVDVLNDTNKDILKGLIDKIGIKISNFDFMLKNSSDELRFKCKLCSVMMRPETVESHLNYAEHVKYSQLSKVSNLGFESLNDSNKKLVRKLFNKIGSKINDFDVMFSFVCKICGVSVSTETAANHLNSEEHLKHFNGHSSQDNLATDVSGAKSSLDCNNDSDKIKGMATKTLSANNSHSSVRPEPEPCQSANLKLTKTYNDITERMAGDTNPSNTAVAGKLLVDGKVSDLILPSLSVRDHNCHHKIIQENKYATTMDTNRTRHILENPSDNEYLIPSARNQSHGIPRYSHSIPWSQLVNVSSTDETFLPPEFTQKLDFMEGEKYDRNETSHKTETRSKLVPGLVTSNSSQIFSCAICLQAVSSTDIRNHVNSVDHAISLLLSSPVYLISFLSYYREVVKMFTGHLSNETDKFEILYELPKHELNFFCKFCYVIVSAESLESHINREHLNNFPEEREIATAKNRSQPFKEFVCEPCNVFVFFKNIATHVSSKAHSESLSINRNSLRFDSFITYKKRVMETIAPSKSMKMSDFELFYEINSSKLHIYCKTCELLLRPEFLDAHVELPQHALNSHIMEQWDSSYGPYHRSFYASKVEISNNLPPSPVNTSTDWCSIM